MKEIIVDRERVWYDRMTDILFVSFGHYDLSCIDREEYAGDGVYLQYAWPNGELASMEVWHFSERYGKLPATISIHSPEDLEVHVPEEDFIVTR